MKKLMVALLVAGLFVGAAMAQQRVVSVNVVGFKRVSVPANGLVLVGQNFDDFGKSINDMFAGQLTGAGSQGSADQIIVYDPTANAGAGGYDIYWKFDTFGGAPGFDGSWIDPGGGVANSSYLLPGQAFWAKSVQGTVQTLTFMGEAVNDTTYTSAVPAGLSMLSVPYAADLQLTNTGFFASGAVGSTSQGGADQLIFYQGGAYKTAWLFDGGGTAFDGEWIDADSGSFYTNDFEVGQGAWYRHQGAGFPYVENRPYGDLTQE